MSLLRNMFCGLLTAGLLTACGGGGSGGETSSNTSGGNTTPTAQAKWTYMVYVAGDNNLSDDAIKDINEMEQVGSTGAVNIVVQAEFSPNYSPGQTANTKRGRIIKDTDTNAISSLSDLPQNRDMGDPAQLTDFINWTKTNYPADHYALVLWSHGDGWKKVRATGGVQRGALQDESAGSYMAFPSIAQAINNAGGGIGLIDFDACLMGMYEVAYQLRNVAQALVASAETEPGTGNPYDTLLADLIANPNMTALQLGNATAQRYAESYAGFRDATTKSSYDLSKVDAFRTALLNVTHHLQSNFTDERANLQNARDQALQYTEPGNRDLGTVLARLQAGTSDTTLQGLISALTSAANNVVSYKGLNDTASASPVYANASTLAIYLPDITQTATGVLTNYALLDASLSDSYSWSGLVNQLVTGDSGTPAETATGNFAFKLVWNDSKADLDLFVWEPDGVYAAYDGTNTPNGFFSSDSSISGKAEESYTAASTIAKGSYDVFVNYYEHSDFHRLASTDSITQMTNVDALSLGSRALYGKGGLTITIPTVNATLYYKDPGNGVVDFTKVEDFTLDFSNPAPDNLGLDTIIQNLYDDTANYSDWRFSTSLTRAMPLRLGAVAPRTVRLRITPKPRYDHVGGKPRPGPIQRHKGVSS